MAYYRKKRMTRKPTTYKKKRTFRKKVKKTATVDRVVTKNFRFIGATALTTNQSCLIGNSKNLTATNSIAFRPSMIPGTKNFENVYTHYRFDSIKVRFIPQTVTMQVDDMDNGTSASGIAKATPRFYLTRIYGNEIVSDFTYENENSALIDGAKSVQMTKGIGHKWVPNSLSLSQTQRSVGQGIPNTVGYQVQKKTWHSTADMNTLFYGLKYFISSTTADDGEYLYKCIVDAKISWKGTNDANYTSDFGNSATLITPITNTT